MGEEELRKGVSGWLLLWLTLLSSVLYCPCLILLRLQIHRSYICMMYDIIYIYSMIYFVIIYHIYGSIILDYCCTDFCYR